MAQTQLIPRVKAGERFSRRLLKTFRLECIVVSLQDFISPFTYQFTRLFYEVAAAGGLHAYYGFEKKIILSFIMKDNFISNTTVEMYAYAIQALKPNACTTLDGEGYEGETYRKDEVLYFDNKAVVAGEIERCYRQTKELMSLCPEVSFIGLVKGCNREQVIRHTGLLKSLGIKDFALHIGDFLRNDSPYMISRAKLYTILIRKEANKLYLFGMSSQGRLMEFSFADFYVSRGYFVNAYYGKRYYGTKKLEYSGGYSESCALWNLSQMIKNVKRLSFQRKLTDYMKEVEWEAELIAEELVTQADMAATMRA